MFSIIKKNLERPELVILSQVTNHLTLLAPIGDISHGAIANVAVKITEDKKGIKNSIEKK